MSSTVSTTVPSRSNTTGSNPGCGRGSDTEPLQVELPGGELGEQFGIQQVVAQRRDVAGETGPRLTEGRRFQVQRPVDGDAARDRARVVIGGDRGDLAEAVHSAGPAATIGRSPSTSRPP